MKPFILSLIATTAAAATLHAHCGTCSTGAGADGHADTCASLQLKPYFEAQAGLANDDLAAAQDAAASMLEMGDEKGCSTEKGSCCAAELSAAAKIAEASDLKAARQAFKSWSDTLINALDEQGLPHGTAVKMHCPMAFGNQGGSWLQASADLRNPYYGSTMLTCGAPQKEYGEAAPSNTHAH